MDPNFFLSLKIFSNPKYFRTQFFYPNISLDPKNISPNKFSTNFCDQIFFNPNFFKPRNLFFYPKIICSKKFLNKIFQTKKLNFVSKIFCPQNNFCTENFLSLNFSYPKYIFDPKKFQSKIF